MGHAHVLFDLPLMKEPEDEVKTPFRALYNAIGSREQRLSYR